MSSLQEQLLKAGLVNKRTVQEANQKKQKQANQTRKSSARHQPTKKSTNQQRQEKKAEHDRSLNQQRQQRLLQKEAAAQIKQMLEEHKIDRSKAEIDYRFVHKKKVKTILVTADQKQAIARGQLAIVTSLMPNHRQFDLVPSAIAAKISERDATSIVPLDQGAETELVQDDYADYQVPDDLIW